MKRVILLSEVIPYSIRMQAVDEIYVLLRTAGTRKQPVAARYEGHPRLFCPHVLGKEQARPAVRILLSVWRNK
jgi:hypothetical protein